MLPQNYLSGSELHEYVEPNLKCEIGNLSNTLHHRQSAHAMVKWSGVAWSCYEE